ncbi:hypothetical protein [Acaryochloris marina]|uniref:Uncharacterized protein n=1 Tax=Acaryochloris marina (strain MBIC 11017) TaxID=329726 RepID=A8ZP55_ACAM1|nr:hypothetical protein [Acaryochloris marina]ABW32791.1 hypothetical protein AM1_E0021 [Acaryochloris marina MBIC11017]
MPILSVTTDQNGFFMKTEEYDPPGPFPLNVNLSAKLLSPDQTKVSSSLDIDAVGGETNQKRDFQINTGEEISLGEWRIDGGNNIIIVNGKTTPVRANTEIEIELNVSL